MTRFLPLLVLLFSLLGCRQGPPEPEEPVWGKQPCAHCAMLLSQKSSAAQAIDVLGDHQFFDDLGCLVAWQDTQKPSRGPAWTRAGTGWLPVEQAHYTQGAHTPMDFGFEQDPAGTVRWPELQAAVKARLAKPLTGAP